MNIKNIISILSGLLMLVALTGCEGEKDLIIIDGNLPIKTSTLYMVGDATPNGWSLDAATALTPTDEDPLVFSWEGPLNVGEMKLCLATGSWDNPFIRPQNAGEEINKKGLTDETFKMHAGDPDDKWKVSESGIYNLRFDLRNWTMSATYVREQDAPVIDPIVADALYIVGDFNGWNIDSPTQLEKKSDYIFVYEGPLTAGEMKACLTTGSWDASFIRPETNGCRINRNGVESGNFVYSVNPDNKWKIEEPGIYRLTFDLQNWTIAAEYTGDFKPAPKLYMIGEATDGGWSWDAATVIEASSENENIFVWEGELGRGSFKASEEKDFGAPFYRPSTPDCEVSDKGVTSNEMVHTTGPDDQWLVTVAGKYRLTFNTADMTFNAEFLSGSTTLPSLYMIGEATAGGWSLDDATEISTSTENIYVWEGNLKEGTFKACLTKDFSAPFYRPATADCEISENGAASSGMVFTTGPDDQWKVVKAGKYRLTFNLADMTFEAKYLEAAVTVAPLYMIGEATAGGWSLDAATEFTPVDGTEGEYTWTGTLKTGTFKVCSEKDFSAPFYRPSKADVEVSESGVAANDMVYTTGPDDQWKVVKEGRYELTLNIKAMTINVKYLD
ncbi:SusF/SusE family outer membrane protein [uncultured Duncaniella sp.]|uniref:SusF/SusE family outer membrane protein n=1 Tax=uncultured Duncaniella sp. TaxID=2768039 RepID=UPI0026088471|nr:SusF/SusE family outer membrane protein [uncultured Duncaniella sp.]